MIAKLNPSNRTGQKGFTLVELMIVVAIIGILAAVAIPAFMRYMNKAKSTEAEQLIKKIQDGARAYYYNPSQPGLTPVQKQFPGTVGLEGPTPAADCCADPSGAQKCSVDATAWNTPVWQALNFSVDDPHYYGYTYELVSNTDFIARATGDLDCDGVVATFEMAGGILPDGSVSGSASIRRVNESE